MLRLVKNFSFFIFLIILFRGFLFRSFVSYKRIGKRPSIELYNKNLRSKINQFIEGEKLSITQIIELTTRLTVEELSFTFTKVSSRDINAIIGGKKANCIGYATLFNSIGNYIVTKQNLSNQYKFVHLIGEVYVLGINVHPFVKSPFFKDHDFNQIIDKKLGESIFVDSSLSDYFKITYVKLK